MDYRVSSIVAFNDEDGTTFDKERMKLLNAKSNRLDGSLFKLARMVMGVPLKPWKVNVGDKPVNVAEVVNLTTKFKTDRTLDWQVSVGQWTIITTGHVATGADVRCVLPEVGYVLEVE